MSYYKNPITNTQPAMDVDLVAVFSLIKNDGYLKELTVFYQEDELSDESKDEIKREEFPFVTFSGTFSKRTNEGLLQYSGLVCMDVDNIPSEELHKLKAFAAQDKYTVLAYTSPNKGYKIVIRTPGIEKHKEAFFAYRQYLSDKTGISLSHIDTCVHNISRPNFICHDEDAFINPLIKAGKFAEIHIVEFPASPVDVNKEKATPKGESLSGHYQLDFDHKNLEANFRILCAINEKKEGAYQSPRQPWVQKLASRCNVFGMSRERTLELVIKHFKAHPESLRKDKPINVQTYLIQTVNDVYSRYASAFDTWQRNDKTEECIAPNFPDELYTALPPFFGNIRLMSNNPTERDILLLAAMGVLSTCFPSCQGVYGKRIVGSNLFIFITAPSAAGKGCISVVRKLGIKIQEHLNEHHVLEMAAYKEQQQEYKQALADGAKAEAPIEPKCKLLFIPANSSSSKFYQTLSVNRDFGMILDTEADTLSQAFKNEWGNFSDIIRKTFHHEPIEMQRKLGNEYISIEETFLSIVLTGTPNQVNRLLNNVENGLFSRLLFYDFEVSEEWQSQFVDKDIDLPEVAFTSMGIQLFPFYERMLGIKVKFMFSSDQEKKFDQEFSAKRKQLMKIYGNEMVASLQRLGLICFRLAMIITICRYMNEGSWQQEEKETIQLTCTDADFNSSMVMIECLLQHTISVYTQMKAAGSKSPRKVNKKADFLYNLPTAFDRKTYLDVARLLNIKDKTAEYYISCFVEESLIIREEHNSYVKA